MEEQNNINITFNEIGFTNVCKEGFIRYLSDGQRREFYLAKLDIIELLNNSKLIKKIGLDIININLNINKETTVEVIKRSPLYSNLLD